jgi:arylsulfatase A-like enzyme/Tfp pilus assembly protein PilF
MLSGRWPWRDGLRVNGDVPARPHPNTLPTLLRDAGWRTAGFVSCAALDGRLGFAEGFDHFDDRTEPGGGQADVAMAERRAQDTVEAALAWLGDQPAPDRLFLWVHLFDPHQPYRTAAHSGFEGYLAEVAYADAQLHELASGLESHGRSPGSTLWLVLADHGEALGAHGASTHGLLLHGAATRIPLLVAGPGIEARRDPRLASSVDVFATLIDALGLDVPVRDGRSLLAPEAPERDAVPLETLFGLRAFGLSPGYGLRTREWLWEASPRDHLWHVGRDPAEEHELAADRAEVVAKLEARRRDFGQPETAPRPALPGALREQLEALGYAQGTATRGEGDLRAFALDGEDWFEKIAEHERNGRYEEAERYVARFLERYPNASSVWLRGGFVALGREDHAEAELRFLRALELDPELLSARLNLGNVYWMAGRYADAESAYRQVLEVSPDDLYALYNLGAMLRQQGRRAEGDVLWARFLREHPDHPNASRVAAALGGEPR